MAIYQKNTEELYKYDSIQPTIDTVVKTTIEYLFKNEEEIMHKMLQQICLKNKEIYLNKSIDINAYIFSFKGNIYLGKPKSIFDTSDKKPIVYLDESLWKEGDCLIEYKKKISNDQKFINIFLRKHLQRCLDAISDSIVESTPKCCGDILFKKFSSYYSKQYINKSIGKFDDIFINNDEFKKFIELVNFYKTKQLVL